MTVIIDHVLDRVRADLVGTPFRVVTDGQAGLLGGHNEDSTLPSELDEIALAAHGNSPALHTLAEFAVAVAPISDPRTGRPIGVVGLMCRIESASELMVSYVRRISRDIEDGLLGDASASERALTAHFVRVRRHVRGAIVSLNEQTMIANAAAARLVDDADRSMLWDWSRQAIARGQTAPEEIRLPRGITATARCERVEAAGVTVGALVHLDPKAAPAKALPSKSGRRPAPRRKREHRPTLGWASLSAAQLGIADLVARGLTNGEIAAQVYLSRHTVDFHLRQIFAKLSIDSRVELARLVSERKADERQAS